VIFGRGDGLFNLFARLLAFAPVLPVACPSARFQPVYVGDVVERMVAALPDRATFGARYNLCGPEVWSLMDVVRYTAGLRGYRRLLLPLPNWAARLQANIFELFPGKPFSRDNYASLQVDSVCPEGGTCPTTVDAVVPYYLGDETRQHRLQELRQEAGRHQPPT